MMLTEIMANYLNESSFEVENEFRPLNPRKSNWETKDDKLKRVYEFETMKQFEAFIVEMLKYNRETNAEIETRFRNNVIGVIIYSLSGSISEIELEAAKDIDKIKKDVTYYYAKP